jgi:hypothetical protein
MDRAFVFFTLLLRKCAYYRPMRIRVLVTMLCSVLVLGSCGTGTRPTLEEAAGDLVPRGAITGTNLDFDPTGEFIFPSVFHAGEYLSQPLGEWYLYYAPHEAPGGIAVMYSDSLAGPWTEFADNPVISHSWQPHYEVSHISSPDAFWNEDEDTIFLYFHGENSQTRYATSGDGTTFTYGGVAIEAADVGSDTQEASYARVFALPRAGDDKFGMFFMAKHTDDTRDIRLATSPDGRAWSVRANPVITALNAEAPNLSGADLVRWHGSLTIVYHASDGVIHGRSINEGLNETGAPTALFSDPEGVRVAAPEFVADGNELLLFYERGERLEADIAWASPG